MSKVSVFDHGWIDLVFEGRNKSYGAYQLRKQDSKTTIFALITGILLMGALVGIPAVINYFSASPVTAPPALDKTVEVKDVYQPPKKPEPPKPQPLQQTASAAAPTSITPTVRYTPPVVSNTPTDAELPQMSDFENANPGPQTNPGDGNGTIVLGTPGTGNNTSGSGTGTEDNGLENSMTVDVAPYFPGGLDAFYKKVGKEFNPPRTDTKITLRVYVSFIVERDGTMTGIRVINDPGHGMGREAIRVLKSIKTKWEPGIKNGKPVRTAYSLPIVVNIN